MEGLKDESPGGLGRAVRADRKLKAPAEVEAAAIYSLGMQFSATNDELCAIRVLIEIWDTFWDTLRAAGAPKSTFRSS